MFPFKRSISLSRYLFHRHSPRLLISGFTGLFLLFVAASITLALEIPEAKSPNICEREAPWNTKYPFDKRAEFINLKMGDKKPAIHSTNPAAILAGFWQVELKDIPSEHNLSKAAILAFYQEGEGYNCNSPGCSYKPAKVDARWLVGGRRWGHTNGSTLLSKESPSDYPPSPFSISDSGEITIPQPQYFGFPGLTLALGKNPNMIKGRWTFRSLDIKESGEAILTRFTPTVTHVEFISTIKHAVDIGKKGCVAMDYGGAWWSSGNNMRGNRPGFLVKVFGKGFHWFQSGRYKAWIDPETKLEIESTGVIYEKDENEKRTGKILGIQIRLTIWPDSQWGPKTLWVEGQPIPFDYYVKPVYPFLTHPSNFQLVEGHFPEKPKTGAPTYIGFRLAKLPDHASLHTKVNYEFIDAETGEPAKDITLKDEACKQAGEGKVQCTVGPINTGQVKEFEFEIPMTPGGLRWTADWKSEGHSEPSIRFGTIEATKEPIILHAVSLSDQTGVIGQQNGRFAFPYTSGGNISQLREVLVLGKYLPQNPEDQANIASLDSAIEYEPQYGPFYQKRREEGWKLLSKQFGMSVEALKKDTQLLLLRAKINGTVLPGEKSFTLNGQQANWELRFGGLKAIIEFIRPSGNEQPDEPIETAYLPERIQGRITISERLPLETIELELRVKRAVRNIGQATILGTNTTEVHRIKMAATRQAGGKIYLTREIRLVKKGKSTHSPPPRDGDFRLYLSLTEPRTDWLSLGIDETFGRNKLSMSILPATAELPISLSPGKQRSATNINQEANFLFKDRLQTVANCHKIPYEDWNKLTLKEAEAIRRFVLFTFDPKEKHIKRVKITAGHHAIMLLLRDVFVEMANEQIRLNNDISGSPINLKGFLEAMRHELHNDKIPINRILVSAPDGRRVRYGDNALYEDTDFLAKKFNSTPEKMAEWRITATAEALSRLSTNASEIAAQARAIDKCKAKDLLKLVGVGFQPVVDRLKPRLMRLETRKGTDGQTRLYWIKDPVARYWLDDVAKIQGRIARIDREAKKDNIAIALLFGAGSLPVMFSSHAAAFAIGAIDLSMLGNDAFSDWSTYFHGQAEIVYAKQAEVVLGLQRGLIANKKAMTWWSLYKKTLLNAGMGGLVLLGIRHDLVEGLLKAPHTMIRGRSIVRTMRRERAALRNLNQADRMNVELFALRSRARAYSIGHEALDNMERRALNLLDDEFRAARTQLIPEEGLAKTVGFGDEITLPPPFHVETAIIQFKPQVLAKRVGPEISDVVSEELPVSMVLVRMADEVPGGASGARAPPRSEPSKDTIDARMNQLEGQEIFFDLPNNAGVFILHLGSLPIHSGRGSFKAAYPNLTRRSELQWLSNILGRAPWEEYKTVAKVTFGGGHDLAEIFGRKVWPTIPSQHLAFPRELAVISVPPGATGLQRYMRELAIVEDFEGTAAQVVRASPNGVMTEAQLNAYKGGIDDINDAGYVWLDCKADNFTFVTRDNQIKLGIIDYGGIVQVKGGDPKLAREIQNVVNGPIEPIIEELKRMGRTAANLRYLPQERFPLTTPVNQLTSFQNRLLRHELLAHKYGTSFENLLTVGVDDITHLPFAPIAGNQFSAKTATYFTAAQR